MAVQDFTTYTEVDPSSRLTVTSSKVAWASQNANDSAGYVYKDMGAAHFAGDFEHLLEVQLTSAGTFAIFAPVWMMANNINNMTGLRTANQDFLGVRFYWDNNGSNYQLQIIERDGASEYTDDTSGVGNLSAATTYYLKIKRDESVGTHGTFYCYIYTDSGRTSLFDTLSIALHTSKKDYRYIYGESNYVTGDNRASTGFSQNLDLQESTSITVSPSAVASTFSIPAATVTAVRNVTVTPLVLSASFSLPAAAVSGGAAVNASVQTATFSIPSYDILIADTTVSPSALAATLSIPAYSILTDHVLTPSPLTGTFSIPTPTISTVRVVTLTPSPLTLSFSLLTPSRIGGLWTNQSRSSAASLTNQTRSSSSWSNQERAES